MNRRLALLLSLLAAALIGFGLGWWLRDPSDEPLERRAQRAAEQLRDTFRSLTH
jgi:hypothetical protein